MSKMTPIQLLEAGKSWVKLYMLGIKNSKNNTELSVSAIYCLFFGLEMHLKAYLVSQDQTFASNQKLKKLGHSFRKISKEISKANGKFQRKIKTTLEKYNLIDEPYFPLRYPQKKKETKFSESLFATSNEIIELCQEVQKNLRVQKSKETNS